MAYCLGKIVQSCKHCKFCMPDVDVNHHPNNFDCPYYHPIGMVFIDVQKKQK